MRIELPCEFVKPGLHHIGHMDVSNFALTSLINALAIFFNPVTIIKRPFIIDRHYNDFPCAIGFGLGVDFNHNRLTNFIHQCLIGRSHFIDRLVINCD